MPVYFIQVENDNTALVKIGKAKNVSKRLADLQTFFKERLIVLGVIDGYTKEERTIHKQFGHLRTENGEWFRPEKELLEFIRDFTKQIPIKYRDSLGSEENMGASLGVRIEDGLYEQAKNKAGLIPLSRIARVLLEKWINGEVTLES